MVIRWQRRADIAIEDGQICAIGRELPGRREEIDARGLTIFPGLIDVHVHFNEPGRTSGKEPPPAAAPSPPAEARCSSICR